MSSIFVDTIRKIGGTLGTDIRVKTTSVYESENSTGTTQNLVQGLAKSWLSSTISSNTHTIQDSFNVGSVTDDGAGRTDLVFTNNMANDDYSATQSAATNGDQVFANFGNNALVTTSNFRNNTANHEGTILDYEILCATVHGDLA